MKKRVVLFVCFMLILFLFYILTLTTKEVIADSLPAYYELVPCSEPLCDDLLCPPVPMPLERTVTPSGIVDCDSSDNWNAELINHVSVVLKKDGCCRWKGYYTASDNTKYLYKVEMKILNLEGVRYINEEPIYGFSYFIGVPDSEDRFPQDERWIFQSGTSGTKEEIHNTVTKGVTLSNGYESCKLSSLLYTGAREGIIIDTAGSEVVASIITNSNLLSYIRKAVKVNGDCYGVKTSESSDNAVSVSFTGYKNCSECLAGSCEVACQTYYSTEISSLIEQGKIKKEDIKSKCTNGYDIDQTGENDVWGEKNFILNKLPKNIPKELVWNPEKDGIGEGVKDMVKNGENYCYDTRQEHKDWGKGNHDCVCYATPECVDEDKDGYGKTGTYDFMCSKGGGDCIEEDSQIDFSKSAGYKKAFYQPNNYHPDSPEKVLKSYINAINGIIGTWGKSSGNKNKIMADEVNPGKKETFGLYNDFIHIKSSVLLGFDDFKRFISACDDGVDNDCDGFTDCSDSGCASSAYIEFRNTKTTICDNTCGAACVEEHKNMAGAICVESEAKLTQLKGDNPGKEYKELVKKDYSDCSKGNLCVCIIGACNDACELKQKQLESGTKDVWVLFNVRESTECESEDAKCYLEGGIKKKDKDIFAKFVSLPEEDYSCCCGMCEKKQTNEFDSRSFGESFEKWIAKNLGIEENIKTNLLKNAKDNVLFNKNPPYYDLITTEVKKVLSGFICDEVVDYIIDEKYLTSEEKEKSGYGAYSLAILKIMEERGIIKKTNYIVPNPEGEDEKVPRYELIDESYRTVYNDLIKRRGTLVSIMGQGASVVPHKDCKMCINLEDLGSFKRYRGSSLSYFIFDDMITGKFSGTAYSIEPHGTEFLKKYTLEHQNDSVIFKYSEKDFENCSVENVSASLEFIISPESETNFSYDNFTFGIPANAVEEDLTLKVTKVSFNCPPLYEARPLPETIDLSVILREIKKELFWEPDFGYINDLIELWKLI